MLIVQILMETGIDQFCVVFLNFLNFILSNSTVKRSMHGTINHTTNRTPAVV